MATGENALNGVFEWMGIHTFDSFEEDRMIEWQKRPYFNRGKIMIGDKAIDDSRLNGSGHEKVPAGQQIRVFEMTVKFY